MEGQPLGSVTNLFGTSRPSQTASRLSITPTQIVHIPQGQPSAPVADLRSRRPTLTPPERPLLDSYLMDVAPEKEATPPSTPVVSSSSVLRHQAMLGRGSDLRSVCLRESLAEIFPELNVKSADEVKTPYDYWSYVEAVFLPLRSSMFPSQSASVPVLQEAKLIGSQPEQPHYSWVWSLEDCIDWSQLSRIDGARGAAESVWRSLPRPSNPDAFLPSHLAKSKIKNSVCETHASVRTALNEQRVANESLLEALRRVVFLWQSSESDNSTKRSKCLQVLANYSASTYERLFKEQIFESVEEIFEISGQTDKVTEIDKKSFLLVFDDCEKVRASTMSESEKNEFLDERNKILPLISETKFPLLGSGGPACHICRQKVEEMPKCGGKLQSFFQGIEPENQSGLNRKCHRRYCLECLRLYNWPLPTSNGNFTCPVCAKICTCDRCVRNVYINSTSSFAIGCGKTISKSERPGRPVSFDEFTQLAPNSHFLSTKPASPIKKLKREISTVESAPEVFATLDELLTAQSSRVREAERQVALNKAINKYKAVVKKRIDQVKNLLKEEELELNRRCFEAENFGVQNIEIFLSQNFPSLNQLELVRDVTTDADGSLAAEYQKLLRMLCPTLSYEKLVPIDSDTDEEETSRSFNRLSKIRRIETIQGSADHLNQVCIAAKSFTHQIPKSNLHSSGLPGLRYRLINNLQVTNK